MSKSRFKLSHRERTVAAHTFTSDVWDDPWIIAEGVRAIAAGNYGADALAQARRMTETADAADGLAALVGKYKYNLPYAEARRFVNDAPRATRRALAEVLAPIAAQIHSERLVRFGPLQHQRGKWSSVEWSEFDRGHHRAPAKKKKSVRVFTPPGMKRVGKGGVFRRK